MASFLIDLGGEEMLLSVDGCALENGKRRKNGNEISSSSLSRSFLPSLLPLWSELISHISQGQEEEEERIS